MDLAHELHDLVRTLDRHAERLLRPTGLTYRRYVALVIIAEHPGITGRRLSGALGVTEAAGSGLVRALIAAELIDNVASAGAGHVRHLRVSARGLSLLRHCSGLLGASLGAQAHAIGIDPDELAHTLRRLHDAVRIDDKKLERDQ